MSAVDRLLGRLTMYRLVTLALTAIVLSAVVLAVLGPVQQDPLAIAVVAAVTVATSVVASRACGALWRTRVHTESAVITGLILALLFWPQLTVGSLAVAAGAALLASVSKFVVAVRSRHVLNPAAAGALVSGLVAVPFGGFPAAWWVATPALLPVVALAALVVVLRTRRGLLVLTYLAAALAVLLPRLAAGGAAPLDALLTALQSYPLVFAAGFMLTEPLTLPPRRRQQLAEAALVGALTVVPVSLGVLYASPELALVVGNVLAFTVGQRRAVHLRVLTQRMVAPGIRRWRSRPTPRSGSSPGSGSSCTSRTPRPTRGGPAGCSRWPRRPTTRVGSPSRSGSPTRPARSSRRSARCPTVGSCARPAWAVTSCSRATPPCRCCSWPGGIGITPFVSQLAHAGPRRGSAGTSSWSC